MLAAFPMLTTRPLQVPHYWPATGGNHESWASHATRNSSRTALAPLQQVTLTAPGAGQHCSPSGGSTATALLLACRQYGAKYCIFILLPNTLSKHISWKFDRIFFFMYLDASCTRLHVSRYSIVHKTICIQLQSSAQQSVWSNSIVHNPESRYNLVHNTGCI